MVFPFGTTVEAGALLLPSGAEARTDDLVTGGGGFVDAKSLAQFDVADVPTECLDGADTSEVALFNNQADAVGVTAQG